MSSSVETAAGGTKALDAYHAGPPGHRAPPGSRAPALLWKRGLTVAGILVTLFTLDVITIIFADYWLFQSLGLTSVFWTNFVMGAELYVSAFLVFAAAIAVPAYTHDVSPRMRRAFARRRFWWRRSRRTWRRPTTPTSSSAAAGSPSIRRTRSSTWTSASTPSTCPISGSRGST